jgi:multimeric flavodoxin WrbA
MEVVCVLGSPRVDGNSATIARRFCDTAEARGARIAAYRLNDLEYRGCQACFACKAKLDSCALDDDLSEVLEAVARADVLVMATPVYFGEVSSQLKGFIDRTFSFLTPDYAVNPEKSRLTAGKKLVFVISQGHPKEELFADIYPRYQYFFNWLGFTESELIRACGVYSKEDVQSRDDVLKQAEDAAASLFL